MKSYEYIEKVKEVMELDSDYKVCKILNWPTNRATMYKNGQTMDNEAARQIAEILNVSVWQIIADMESERQKSPAKKTAWKKLAKMTAQAGHATSNLLINIAIFGAGLAFCILCKIDERENKICDLVIVQ